MCRRLRDVGVTTPVLLLTARGEVRDRIHGLDAGADDYLAKPFDLDELLARLRALVRRSSYDEQQAVAVGDLVVDAGGARVSRGGVAIELSAREFDILWLLASRAGRVVSRFTILDEVWDGETDLRSNVIDVHLGAIRAKVDRPFGTASITTVRGAGYRLEPSAEHGCAHLPLRVRLVAGFSAAMLLLLSVAGGVRLLARAVRPRPRPRHRDRGSPGRDHAARRGGRGGRLVRGRGGRRHRHRLAGARRRRRSARLGRAGSRPTARPRGRAAAPPGPGRGRRRQHAAGVQRRPTASRCPRSTTVARRRTSWSRSDATTVTRRCASCCSRCRWRGWAHSCVASLVGDQLARLALRPVERYRRRAAEIAAGSSHLRLEVPDERDDEVTRLGHTLNEMLAALDESLERERQFVGDASHELRTPLTLLSRGSRWRGAASAPSPSTRRCSTSSRRRDPADRPRGAAARARPGVRGARAARGCERPRRCRARRGRALAGGPPRPGRRPRR